jgi:hypothetical protein
MNYIPIAGDGASPMKRPPLDVDGRRYRVVAVVPGVRNVARQPGELAIVTAEEAFSAPADGDYFLGAADADGVHRELRVPATPGETAEYVALMLATEVDPDARATVEAPAGGGLKVDVFVTGPPADLGDRIAASLKPRRLGDVAITVHSH